MDPLRPIHSAKARGIAAAAAMSAAVALPCGCATDPTVRATGAQRVTATDQATEVRLRMELLNPNDAPLELITWDYTAWVNGEAAYRGRWMASLTLPPNLPISTDLPIVVPASAGDLSGARWRIEGELEYRATRNIDRLLYQIGIKRLHCGFSVDGTGIAEAPKPPATPEANAPTPPAAPPAGAAPAPNAGPG